MIHQRLDSLDGAAVAGLGHLQRQPHHQLHEGVEHDVLHVDVDELVSQEPPHLVPPGGVIDEEGADRGLTREHGVSHQVRDQVAVCDVEDDLALDVECR